VRAATFNVKHCQGLDGRTDPARTATVLQALGAEVMALQELDRGMLRSAGVDQPAALAAALGMEVHFERTISLEGGEYGIGLAGRGLSEVGAEALPGGPGEEPRRAVWGRRGAVWFVCTHLSLRDESQRKQVEALATILAGLGPRVVLLGDLNGTARTLGPLLAAGFDPGRRRRTHPARFPTKQIDWVLGGPGVHIGRTWTLRTKASDHLPLVAEVELPDAYC
jgi:endonuclease/exonuclease/phosphatase family metal-dependent hydrolase